MHLRASPSDTWTLGGSGFVCGAGDGGDGGGGGGGDDDDDDDGGSCSSPRIHSYLSPYGDSVHSAPFGTARPEPSWAEVCLHDRPQCLGRGALPSCL
mmetsp:Transcript_13316/g.19998  ORF Transcript_13316/g.19998 Transcript_13316/m.19998 type:complete len:97 (+) Transcript_13316:224-514(+)